MNRNNLLQPVRRTMCRRVVAAVLPAVACMALFAACSKDDAAGDRLPAGEYPMTFATTVEGVTATRATTDNTWAGTEEVAVQVGSGNPKKYTAATDGKLSAANGETPFYWESTTETKTVSAWYPYTATKPTTFTVKEDQSGTDQSGTDGYQASDLIYAASQTVTYSGSKELTFKHLPVKVVINLKTGAGVTADEVANASVSIVGQATESGAITDGTTSTDATTGGTNTADWSVAQVTSGNAAITPKAVTPAAADCQKSVQALLVPQQMKDKTFIKVTISSNDYYYTPANETDANLQAGQQYTYTLTVTKNGLTVTASGAAVWTGTGTENEVTGKVSKAGFAAADLKSGDYYYSDGTWSDGGYRKYPDNTTATLPIMPVLTDASGNARTVIGIVFWVGNATAKDKTLANDHSGCTHGLVVALKDAIDGTTAWQNSYSPVQEWLNAYKSGQFLSVVSDTGVTDPLNNIQGYNNTKAIEAFNAANSSYVVQAVQKVVDYRKTVSTPTTCSGWYLPSAKELTLLCGQEVADIWNNNSGGTDMRDIINDKLSKLGNYATQISSAFYWSSTEYSYSDKAFAMYVSNGGVSYYRKSDSYRVRCVLVF